MSKSQSYETLWNKRVLPVTGTYVGSRIPNQADCPTGCSATDFMLRANLPLEYPQRLSYDIIKGLSDKDQWEAEKAYQSLVKSFAEKTSKNNGNSNLGNFDSESVIYAVKTGFTSDDELHFYGNNQDSKTDFLLFVKHILEFLPNNPSGMAVSSHLKRAMGAKYGSTDRDDTPMLQLYEIGDLNFYRDAYITDKTAKFTSSVTSSTASLNKMMYPAIAANPTSALAHEVVGALEGSNTWVDGTPRTQIGSRKYTNEEAVKRKEDFEKQLNAILTGGGTAAQRETRERNLRARRALEELDELTVAQESAVRKRLPADVVTPGHNVEFSDAQKACAKALLKEIDMTLYKCIIDNLRGQSRIEASNFSRIHEGYYLVQHLNFFYRGVSTAASTELTTQIVDFPNWFPSDTDPKDSLVRFQELNINLQSFENQGFTDAQQVTFILRALNENIHYHPLSQSLESKDSGSIKVEELIARIVRFYNDTHKGWGFDMTPAERGSKHKNSATKEQVGSKQKKMEKQINSMQAQIQKLSGNKPPWAKRKFNGKQSQKDTDKKPKQLCVICGKTGHLAKNCYNKPSGIVCFKCGKPGHIAPKCKTNSSANAANPSAKKSVKTGDKGDVDTMDIDQINYAQTCTKCQRPGHKAENCRTIPCYKCHSLMRHDWNTCNGVAKAFFLAEKAEEGEIPLVDKGKYPENGTYKYPENGTFKSVLTRTVKSQKDVREMLKLTNRFQLLVNDTDSISTSSKQENCDELVSFALDSDDEDWLETASLTDQ